MTEAAIELTGVTKRFAHWRRPAGGRWWQRERADKTALHPLDMVLPAGTLTGIIGPNGSGKSTLVRILGTLLLPDAGRALVFGHDVVREPMAVRRHLNRVSVEAAFFKELSPWENLLYAARVYGTDGGGLRGRVGEVLGRLGLSGRAIDRPMRELSRGQQQKVAIARSMLATPMLLLLDEPTTGLDPRSKREVQAMVSELREEQGVSILLCTHDLEEAAALGDRVIVMDRGRVLADDAPARLGPLERLFFELTGRALEQDEEEVA
ncbi:MAG: ABC transporter ATP-binding protein [Candidatus Dormibacteraeota bacterium]|nr:ABC transporter ATP-binding protein [Candidatus Dormibacteraeota bacterium]